MNGSRSNNVTGLARPEIASGVVNEAVWAKFTTAIWSNTQETV